MVRTTLALLNDDKMLISQELKGGMSLSSEGRGMKALRKIKSKTIKNREDLKELLNELDMHEEDFFNVDDDFNFIVEFDDPEIISEMLAFNKYQDKIKCKRKNGSEYELSWYSYNWFSDYVYIKNNTGGNVRLIDKTHKVQEFKDQEVAVLKFGEFKKIDMD